MMDDIFDDLIMEGVVVVYLDDILIFTETLEEHRRVTRRVMELLQKNNLFVTTPFYFYFLTHSDDEHLPFTFVYFFRMNNDFALFSLLIKQ